MRLGANIDLFPVSPEQWVQMLRDINATAAVAPVTSSAGAEERAAYKAAAAENDIVIAEVGVWNNTLSPDEAERKKAMDYAVAQLQLAEELEALCCVNVSGARGEEWNAYYPENASADTYTLAVDTVRAIIDAVKPKRTFYTLEPVGWMLPGSPEAYLQLIRDIDRPAFAVHMDYTNFVTGVEKYIDQRAYFEEVFRLLGPYTKSVHAKDIRLMPDTPCTIREVLPGQGGVDFAHVMRLANSLGREMPFLVEHLASFEECGQAVAHLRKITKEQNIYCYGEA